MCGDESSLITACKLLTCQCCCCFDWPRQGLLSKDFCVISSSCPDVKELVIRGGSLKGGVFNIPDASAFLSKLESLELTGCIQQGQLEVMATLVNLTSLTKLSVTLARDHPLELCAITPHLADLPLLESLSLIGIDLHKQDLGCLLPLAKLKRLGHLDIRGAFLPFSTYKTVVRESFDPGKNLGDRLWSDFTLHYNLEG